VLFFLVAIIDKDNMAYATGTDLLARYDSRTIGDLVQDVGARVTSNLDTNTNLLAALEDGAGLINSAALVGNRFTEAQLLALTGTGKAFLVRLNCDLAFAFLRQRRGYDIEQFPLVKETFHYLDRLRLGERIFDVAEAKAAGNTTAAATSQQTILDQNLVRDNYRYFTQRRWTQYQ
jgi:phage gp36-like protein